MAKAETYAKIRAVQNERGWGRYISNTYTLADCPAINSDADSVTISGEFVALEYESSDPDVGIMSAGFYVVPVGSADDDLDAVLVIDEDDFIRCADPELWESWQAQDARIDQFVKATSDGDPLTTSRNASFTELWCTIGAHSWQREAKRGRKPTSCPEHASTAVRTSLSGSEIPKGPGALVELHCELGDHKWWRAPGAR